MEYTLIDTSIWYAMFDPRDQHRIRIKEVLEYIEICHLVLPWTTLYEALRTRLARNRIALQQFELFLKRPNITFLGDEPYRESAFELCFSSSLHYYRPLSMVDCLIRLILDDINVKVNWFATFNKKDFIDIWFKRGIQII